MILTAAVAAQIWLGVLLLLDTPDGPINKFNPAEVAATHEVWLRLDTTQIVDAAADKAGYSNWQT